MKSRISQNFRFFVTSLIRSEMLLLYLLLCRGLRRCRLEKFPLEASPTVNLIQEVIPADPQGNIYFGTWPMLMYLPKVNAGKSQQIKSTLQKVNSYKGRQVKSQHCLSIWQVIYVHMYILCTYVHMGRGIIWKIILK